MSVSATHPPDVAGYLARVRAALADLPAEERDELMADVESSLLDAASDSIVPLAEQLGPPERFAGELRAAAGLAPRPGGTAVSEPPLARLLARARPLVAGVRDLAPAWWILRAYVAVAAFGLITGSGWAYRLPLMPVLHSARVTAVVGLAVLALSIWSGRRGFRAMLVADVALAIAVVPVAIHLEHQYRHRDSYVAPQEVILPNTPGLAFDGRPILNIYPYGRDGRLLHDVRLYDEAGRPLPVGATNPQRDPLRRTVRSASGARLLNAFPIRYFEPGSRRVARPDSAPRPKVPPLRTAPLRRHR